MSGNKYAEHKTYMVGKIVGEMDKVPDGFTLIKVPESEYFVITYEWVPADVQFNHHTGEDGNEPNCQTQKSSLQHNEDFFFNWNAHPDMVYNNQNKISCQEKEI